MEPAIGVALLWLAFGATHVGLTTSTIRGPLAARCGERGFSLLFSSVSMVCFGLLVTYYAAHRFEGAASLALVEIPALRAALIVLLAAGVVLMTASFATYDRSPYAVLGSGSFRPPRGLERVTRHPFFAGLVLFSAAHSLLATRLAGAVFAAGFGAVALVGALHQDRKLLVRLGRPFAVYLEATSFVPFAAALAGRQQIVWRELPYRSMAAGLGLVVVLRAAHEGIFAYGGAVFLSATVASVVSILAQSLRRSRGLPADRSASVESRRVS